MNTFPDWAPPSLVAHLERLTDSSLRSNLKYPDQIVADVIRDERFVNLSDDAIENFRRSVYRSALFLPPHEEAELLQRSLTDLRMKAVWEALLRREKADGDCYRFWSLCTGTIIRWRGEPKLTAKEHREFYEALHGHVAALQSMLGESIAFHHYSVTRLIDDASVEWLVDAMEANAFPDMSKNAEYARFCLTDVVPSIDAILVDIAKKAKAWAEKAPVVLKPRSENAEAHYFVRSLSNYLRGYYGQPLHEVVATTTSVILGTVDFDAGLVRKLVS